MPGRAEAFLSDAQKVYVSPYGCLSSGCCLSGQDERVPEGSQWELKSVEQERIGPLLILNVGLEENFQNLHMETGAVSLPLLMITRKNVYLVP